MLEYPLMSYQPRSPRALPGLRARNTRTQALIRRDIIWQIAVPLAIALLIVLVIAAFFIFSAGNPVRSVWADISLILLILPAGVMGLLALVLLGGSAYGLWYGLRELPFVFKRLQDWAALFSYRIGTSAEKASGVLLTIISAWAGVRKAAADIRSIFRSGG